MTQGELKLTISLMKGNVVFVLSVFLFKTLTMLVTLEWALMCIICDKTFFYYTKGLTLWHWPWSWRFTYCSIFPELFNVELFYFVQISYSKTFHLILCDLDLLHKSKVMLVIGIEAFPSCVNSSLGLLLLFRARLRSQYGVTNFHESKDWKHSFTCHIQLNKAGPRWVMWPHRPLV